MAYWLNTKKLSLTKQAIQYTIGIKLKQAIQYTIGIKLKLKISILTWEKRTKTLNKNMIFKKLVTRKS